jgi:hypothetical protein
MEDDPGRAKGRRRAGGLSQLLVIVVGGVVGLGAFVVAAPYLELARAMLSHGTGHDVVRGTILDHETLQAIAGAKITARSGAMFQIFEDRDDARTNARGEYAVRVVGNRTTLFQVRARGYMPVDVSPEPRAQFDLQLVRATAKPSDLLTPRVRFSQRTDRFRLDLRAGRLVGAGGDFDVGVRIDPAVDSMVIVEAGRGRGLRVEERGHWVAPWISFPANLKWAPDSGYVASARVPRRLGPVICFVRRDQGPYYGAFSLFPKAMFPPAPYPDGWDFDVVYNKAGGRGFCGAERMIFE